jgi:hypothetical protein
MPKYNISLIFFINLPLLQKNKRITEVIMIVIPIYLDKQANDVNIIDKKKKEEFCFLRNK